MFPLVAILLGSFGALADGATPPPADKPVPPAPQQVQRQLTPVPRGAQAEGRQMRFVAPDGAQAVPPPPGSPSRLPEGPQRGQPEPLDSPSMNPLQGPAAIAVQRVRITVRAIAATRAKDEGAPLEIDGRLTAIDGDVRAFANQFAYKGYRLVDEQTFELDFQSPGLMELPGGRSLRVEPLRVVPDGRIQVRLMVVGSQPANAQRLATDYSIAQGRTLLVGGYHVDPRKPEAGTLLIAVTQDRR